MVVVQDTGAKCFSLKQKLLRASSARPSNTSNNVHSSEDENDLDSNTLEVNLSDSREQDVEVTGVGEDDVDFEDDDDSEVSEDVFEEGKATLLNNENDMGRQSRMGSATDRETLRTR